ncbi:DUF4167 domain-containing protein [Emcibacter sp. SYSU 3D8]|uniref:DUF4167 domain-containing protein n=1 Tax=Emcibacter sp. SYSU 3D8 TaxID=3133969 RepID=UPI0031FE8DAB
MRHSNGKRSRGRSGRRPAPQQNMNRAYDSNGPAGKLRGTAAQLVEKYVSLARDARVGRDRVLVENFLQHAEHYQRIMNEIMIAQGIEPQAIEDDEQSGYDEQSDSDGNQTGESGDDDNQDSGNQGNRGQGNGGQDTRNQDNRNQDNRNQDARGQGNGGQNNGGQNNGGQQRNNNGAANANGSQRRDNGGQPAAPQAQSQPQPKPVISGTDDQPDISADIAVDVPPVSLTPPSLPSAPRAIRGRRPRRPAEPREAAPEGAAAAAPAAAAPATEEPSDAE